jgi:glycerate 2-kinase
MLEISPRDLLLELFEAAVGAADPAALVGGHLPEHPRGRTIVLGAGKAAAAMAAAVERHWTGPLEGLVITPYGHGLATERIEVVEAAHPVPDRAGLDAAQRILDLAAGAGEDDLVLFLASGGGSALMALPAPGLTLDDKRAVNAALLACGATIHEINCVRKHLSAIKGGRLAAAAHPARVVTLAISDVPGDDPSVIASGPTVADPSRFADAREILNRYRVTPPDAVARHLEAAADETPKPGDPRLAGHTYTIIATPQDALQAAAARARDAGLNVLVLGDTVEGEARDVALVHAAIARQVARHGEPAAAPCVILSGGETTVTLRQTGGRGGRNREFLLGLLIALDGLACVHGLACDTDGIDGSNDAAGAVFGPDSLARAVACGQVAREALERSDSGGFFAALGDAVVTGPTRTNVNDFRAILVAIGDPPVST